MYNVTRIIFMASLVATTIVSGCSTTKSPQRIGDATIITSEAFYTNSKGFELSAGKNVLLIKYREHNTDRFARRGIYNPVAGVMAVYYDAPLKQREVVFYKIIDFKFKRLLDDVIATPEYYSNHNRHRLDQYFTGNLPYFTRNGKIEGRNIIELIPNREDELLKMKTAGLPLLSRKPSGDVNAYVFEANDSQFMAQFRELGDIFGAGRTLKVVFLPKIVNQSGFKIPSAIDLVNYTIDKDTLSNKYVININKTKEFYYSYEIDSQQYNNIDYVEEGITISPTITVKGKRVSAYYPSIRAMNGDLEIILDSLYPNSNGDKSSLRMRFDIINKSNQYIVLNAISLYINDSVFTWDRQYDLPPLAKLTRQELRIAASDGEDGGGRVVKEASTLERYYSIDDANKEKRSLGIAARYDKNGTVQNILKSSSMSVSAMIKEDIL